MSRWTWCSRDSQASPSSMSRAKFRVAASESAPLACTCSSRLHSHSCKPRYSKFSSWASPSYATTCGHLSRPAWLRAATSSCRILRLVCSRCIRLTAHSVPFLCNPTKTSVPDCKSRTHARPTRTSRTACH